ncbi:hypothetical protein WA158_000094 [Blastocystis sp. Blastoise]
MRVQWFDCESMENDLSFMDALLKKQIYCVSKDKFDELHPGLSNRLINSKLYKKIQNIYNLLDDIPKEDYKIIKSRIFKGQSLKKGGFVSRAGLKLAEVDHTLSFIDSRREEDIYLLYRCYERNIKARGWGMSLMDLSNKKKDSTQSFDGCVWNLDSLRYLCSNNNRDYSLCVGEDKTGDIYSEANKQHLWSHVYQECSGVDLALADGAIEDDNHGYSENECILHIPFFIHELLLMLPAIRIGGSLFIKARDCACESFWLIVYIVLKCFQSFTIIKPNTSRPFNSEFYLCFEDLRISHSNIYLDHVIDFLMEYRSHFEETTFKDSTQIVYSPLFFEMEGNEEFIHYIQQEECYLWSNRISALNDILEYSDELYLLYI